MQDIVIIGAGIIGSFLAYDLTHYNLKVTLVDKHNDIANETTMANSAIIHTGYDPKDGTLKAKLNVEGAKMYPSICAHLHADYQKIGAYIVASDASQVETLNELKQRADKRHISTQMLDQMQIRMEEPNISDSVICALSVPDTAIIYPWQVAISCVEEAVLNGLDLRLDFNVSAIEANEDYFVVKSNDQQIKTKLVINAAGCGSEYVASLVGKPEFTITPKKGQYYVLSKQAKEFVNHIIYPVPTSLGKGVLAVPTTHGNILLGPNNEVTSQDDVSTTSSGYAYVQSQISQIVKNIPYHEVIRSYSGLRPSGNNGDFYIKADVNYPNMIHVACIDSPGLASAPAISRYVIDTLVSQRMDLITKDTHVNRCVPVVMAKLSMDEKNAKVKENPLYAKIVCKCENISYQEIVDAIHSPVPATTIKAIKKRVRPGMGKCQGGFCEVEVAKILSNELNIPLSDVKYDCDDSCLGKEAK